MAILEIAGNIQDQGANNAAGSLRVLKDDGTSELWAVRPSGLVYPGGVVRYDYDFAVDGGAVGTLVLRNGPVLPVGTIIYGGLCRVETAFTTGSTTTVAIQAEAPNDLITAASVAGAPWSTTGTKAIVPVMTAATAVVTTANRQPSMVIGTAAATAGKFTLLLFTMKANS